MAIAALRQILAWGVANIAETLGDLTARAEDEARASGIEAVPAKRRAEHMIGLKLDPHAPGDLAARLAEEYVFVSVRGRSLRVSPHLYNTQKDIERLFEVLEKAFPPGAG